MTFGVLTTELDGTILDANQTAQDLFVADRTHLIGRSVFDMIQRSHSTSASWPNALLGSKTIRLRIERPNGTQFTADLSFAQVPLEGQPVRIVTLHCAAAQDVLVRPEALGLRWSLCYLAGGLGSWTWDLAERVRWSVQLSNFSGGIPEPIETPFDTLVQSIHPLDRTKVLQVLADATQTGEPFDIDHRVNGVDDVVRWVNVAGGVLHSEAGLPLQMIARVRDITECKRTEFALKAAQLEARSASRAQSTFLSSVSHELRAPLTAIIGFSDLIRMDHEEIPTLSLRQSTYLARVHSAGEHLLHLVDDVLDLATVQSGKAHLKAGSVDLTELVAGCISELRLRAEAANIVITQSLDPNRPWQVRAHRGRVRQVIGHLLSNAIDYNRPGGSVVINADNDGLYIRLSVTDTGSGIRTDLHNQVFNPLDRLDETAPPTRRSGIGLSISRELTERMGGQLSFESEQGTGSTFWLKLPAHDPETTSPPAKEYERLLAGIAARSMHVLHIEDAAPTIAHVRGVLSYRLGMSVSAAKCSDSTLRALNEHRPDLVLMDLGLGAETGYDVLQNLRLSQGDAHIPVFVLSATAARADVNRGLAAGFDGYLSKPLVLRSLVTELQRVMNL